MAVLSPAPAPTQNAWTCPTCRHGSPDPRDELAHLDAHRQLGQFLQEWDAAVASDRKRERRHRPAVMLAALLGIVVLIGGAVLWRLAETGGSPRPVAGPVPAPVAPVPVPGPQVSAPPPAVTQPVPQEAAPAPATSPAPPSPVSTVVPTTPAVAAPPAVPVTTPAVASPSAGVAPVSAPPPPPPAPTTTTIDTGLGRLLNQPPPGYLVKICLIGPCLVVA